MDLAGAPVRGMPRYLDGRELLGMPRILEMCSWTVVGVLKKKSLDLSRFRVMPEASVKSDRMELSFCASRSGRVHEEGVIHELAVGGGWSDVVQGKAFEAAFLDR
jgi:hypothetical protein